ncbi:hypothetical protein CCP3SC15_3720002 [Gammaproteobacteria bacterium]
MCSTLVSIRRAGNRTNCSRLVLDNLCALADLHTIYFLWRPCLPDANDDMVLELAVAAQVPRIVSFNAKDFRPVSRFGIEVVTPKIMLEELQ